MDWRDEAACRTKSPELFFPVGTAGPARGQLAQAKSVCRRCPVIVRCRTWALQTDQHYGVWGGLSEDERAERQRGGYRIESRLPSTVTYIPRGNTPQADSPPS